MKQLIFVLFICNFIYAQKTTVSGFIKRQNSLPVEEALIIVKDSTDSIIAYTSSQENGFYSTTFDANSNKQLFVEASSLSFQKKTTALDVKKIIAKDFILEESIETLKEVVIEGFQKIKIDKDTTFIKVVGFVNNTEQTIEDVLKKLPGIEVQKDGTIKAHGKTIDKLLVEGEDIFNQNYKILSRNLDANTLEEVQILENFEDNPVLKSLSNTSKIAINLKLKKGLTNVWFGNISSGFGTEDRFKQSANVGLLKKKIKLFYFADYSNLGTKSSDLLNDNFAQMDLSSNNKVELQTSKLFNTDTFDNSFFQTSQTTFNKAFLNSISLTSKFSKKTTIRTSNSYITDSQVQVQNTIFNYFLPNENIVNTEQSSFKKRYVNGFGETEIKYLHSDNSYFTNYTKYSFSPVSVNNSILFNSDFITEDTKLNDTKFYNHFENSYKITNSKILQTYIYTGFNKIFETDILFSEALNNYLTIGSNEKVTQKIENKLFYNGVKVSFLNNIKKLKFETTLQYHLEKETFQSNLSAYTVEDFSSNSKNSAFLKNIISFNQSAHLTFNKKAFFKTQINLNNTNLNKKNYPLYNLDANYYYKTNKTGSFNISYVLNNNLPSNNLQNQAQLLNSYRSFISGNSNVENIMSNSFLFNYHINIDKKQFSIDLSSSYRINDKNYALKTFVNQNFIFSEYLILQENKTKNLSLLAVKYIKLLKLVSKFELYQNWSTNPMQVNESTTSVYKNYSNTIKTSNSTVFENFVNLDFGFSYNKNESQNNGNKNKNVFYEYFINANYSINKTWIIELKNSNYKIMGNYYYFLNANIHLNPEKSRFSYRLLVNNILNEKEFSTQVIENFSSYKNSVRLVPNYLLLSAKYRF